MKKTLIIIFMALAWSISINNLMAQKSDFFKVGTIEYERKQNIMATFNYDPMFKVFVEKTGSEIYITFFTLTIEPNQSIYQLGKINGPANQFPDLPADNNIIHYDFKESKKIVQKNTGGTTYSITDDERQIQWKLTEEIREIAGYTCRRANAIILDSIYAVAFYCEKFPYQIGPESFAGLPGLILGISLPSEHISWFATKVTPMNEIPKITAPTQKKVITNKDYRTMLENTVLKFPKLGPILFKRALL
jgi:GLPGLI family protein